MLSANWVRTIRLSACKLLAALEAPKQWKATVAGFAAVAVGVVQLTAIHELSLLDRERADGLKRLLRLLSTSSILSRNDGRTTFVREVEAIRRQWETHRARLVRRTFTVGQSDKGAN
jgi:hypothetical protein